MNRSCVFLLSDKQDMSRMIKEFQLKKRFSNRRTSIYENEKMRFSFDNSVVRVVVFDDMKLLDILYNYFYGDEYYNA